MLEYELIDVSGFNGLEGTPDPKTNCGGADYSGVDLTPDVGHAVGIAADSFSALDQLGIDTALVEQIADIEFGGTEP